MRIRKQELKIAAEQTTAQVIPEEEKIIRERLGNLHREETVDAVQVLRTMRKNIKRPVLT